MSDKVYVEQLKVLPIKDGDLLVYKYPKVLPQQTSKAIAETFKKTLNDLGHKNTKIVILEEGADLDVVSQDEVDAY